MLFLLREKKFLAPSVLLVRLEKPAGFVFQAGQHLSLMIPSTKGILPRAFSIASSPHKDTLELIVKIIPGGVASEFFVYAAAGSVIEGDGPRGVFTHNTHSGHRTFLASGTGIAPLRAMVFDLLSRFSDEKISLHFECEEPFLHGEFLQATRDHTRFSFSPRLAVEACDIGSHTYICGAPNFVASTEHILLSRGMLPEYIHYEKY